MNELNPLWLLLAFPLFFVGLWAFVCLLISVIGGWWSLAKAYPLVGIPNGKLLRGRSARIGAARYSRMLNFTAGSMHLHMAPFVLFRIGHAPLSVPWSEITATRERAWFFPYLELRFARTEDPGSNRYRDRCGSRAGERWPVCGSIS